MCRTFLFAVRNRVGYNGVEENGVPRKPLIIILISLCFFISPVFILLQASILTLTPVIGPYNIFSKLSPHDVFILCLYPLCAAAVFSVRRWGWYVFLAASVYLVAANIITFALRPHYHVLSLIIYNLILTVAAGIFFRRDVIAPYFNPPLRWWEQPKRFGVDMFFEITGMVSFWSAGGTCPWSGSTRWSSTCSAGKLRFTRERSEGTSSTGKPATGLNSSGRGPGNRLLYRACFLICAGRVFWTGTGRARPGETARA